jgi:hypothetical protein
MADIMEWVMDNSEYSINFIKMVLAALTDPVSIMKVEYAETMRKIKEMKDDGSYTIKEVLDEYMSGFLQNNVMVNELYISNFRENNIQRQKSISLRQAIDFDLARAKYGNHKNFKYVSPGCRTMFDAVTNTFYDVPDPDINNTTCEIVTYYNRYLDLEIVFINGILVTNPDAPIRRKDKRYGFISTGYEFLNNGNCFYYKSAVNKLANDQDLIDIMYNMIIDGSFLAIMPPVAIYGSEEVDTSIMIPGSSVQFRDTESKVETLGPKSDLQAGMTAIALIEKSINESSQDNFQQGMIQPGERTAEEIKTVQQNAETALGLFGKMIKRAVEDAGNLIVGDILQYMTAADVSEITTNGAGIKFKSVLIHNKVDNGKTISKKIQFTNEYADKPTPTQEDLLNQSLDIMDQEENLGGNVKIYKVNVDIFRRVKFLIKVKADVMQRESKSLEKALNLEAYDRLIQNPVISQDISAMENVTKDFLLNVYRPGDTDKYMPKTQAPQQAQGQNAGDAVAGQVKNQFSQKGVNTNLTGQITGSGSMKNLMSK